MQLPVPPSDSLYKFLCIGSLFAGIALLIWSDSQVTDLAHRHAELKRRGSVTKVEIEALGEDVELHRYVISRSKRAGQEVVEQMLPDIEDRNRLLNERVGTMMVKNAELEADREEMKRLTKEIDRDTDFRIFMVAFLGLLHFSSLSNWYLHVQRYQDRILRAQAEASELALKSARAETTEERGATLTGAAPEAKDG